MAQPFNNAIITNSGAQLITRAQAGEIKIEFTRIAIGNGNYSEDEKGIETLQSQTALRSEQNSYPLSSVDIFSDHSVKITALIANQDPVTGQTLVDNGYFINEMGLFAKVKDGGADTEVLYSITVTTGTNGDFMPPFNGYYPVHIIQDYYATVNNSAEVTIQAGIGAAILNEDYLKLKSDVGNVDIAKGDLQTQLNRIVENLHNFDTIVVKQTGANLDDYVETGIYYFSGSYTPINIPAGTNGWLLVFRSSNTGTVKQLWFRHGTANNSDHNTFVRTKTADTWSNWTRIVTEKDISIPVVLTGTLAANKTSISFTNAAITDTATIDVYTDVFGVNPTNMTISGTKLTLTFTARSAATGVKVKIS